MTHKFFQSEFWLLIQVKTESDWSKFFCSSVKSYLKRDEVLFNANQRAKAHMKYQVDFHQNKKSGMFQIKITQPWKALEAFRLHTHFKEIHCLKYVDLKQPKEIL